MSALLMLGAGLAPATANAQTTTSITAGQPAITHVSALSPIIQIILGQTPSSIPQTISFLNGAGINQTYLPGGAVATSNNPFFDTTLTTNGRSCFTCHDPSGAWTISPPQILRQYLISNGKSPLFQPIDAANCPNTPGATSNAVNKFLTARTLLFERGDFRISINAPNPLGPQSGPSFTTFEGNTPSAFNSSTAIPQWVLTVKRDPTGCENDSTYGLPNNLVSVYRRTMPSANVAFLNPGARGSTLFNIMWDAREPNLENQFVDATESHGQTTIAPSTVNQTAGANFQFGVFAGQINDFVAGDLTGSDGSGALGGPKNLFTSRENVPQGGFFPPNSCFAPESLDGVNFCPGIFAVPDAFTLYTAFTSASGTIAGRIARRQSIARGENIFNTRRFTINDVAGLDDVLNRSVGGSNPPGGSTSTVTGTCSTCHNNANVGNDNFLDPKREGIMDNSNNTNNALPPSLDFPLFAFYCPTGSIPFFSNPITSSNCPGSIPGNPATCDEFDTTDPGLGLADGECEDLGKMKVPMLRSLAARAPYFHGGNVPDLPSLVNFYNTRFQIGLSPLDKADLVNFLNTL